MNKEADAMKLRFNGPTDGVLMIRLSGNWKIGEDLPSPNEFKIKLESETDIQRVAFDTKELTQWDSSLPILLLKIKTLCFEKKIYIDSDGLPPGAKRLIELATAVPIEKDARSEGENKTFLSLVGTETIHFLKSAKEMIAFIGEAFLAFIKFLSGKARFRRSDLFVTIQGCGAQALPIVSLISLLVGLILAFVGAIQLKMFGAQIYIANLVGIAMVRVMGAVMTGIIMAGRTGAAFAAQIGTMEVNEEIDALKTLGISPMEFLVLPRMLALIFMMPLLCIWSDLMGILGGGIVGVGLLDLNMSQYYFQTKAAISLNDLWIGLFHSAVFGVLVALAGCLRGIQCGRSSADVGNAATSAVVTGIVSIIVATAIITVMCNVLGI
ncbi:MAG: ABC transporter permease [Desulfobacteraceae bacterium]|nr:ABC transporter permease [Desulfobacteraceae bacterium]MDH3565759.1 ABC transporter permease [Desulfobacteraceae bacterium]